MAAGSPTANYGVDVHIDTGFLSISKGELLSTVQDLFVTPLWTALVWAVHALVVMLEWCFTIDLLDDPSTGLGGGLRQMQVNLTEPWLASVQQLLLSSEPYAFRDAHLSEVQALCPRARVRLVDGELISWYGPRAVAGLRYLRELAA